MPNPHNSEHHHNPNMMPPLPPHHRGGAPMPPPPNQQRKGSGKYSKYYKEQDPNLTKHHPDPRKPGHHGAPVPPPHHRSGAPMPPPQYRGGAPMPRPNRRPIPAMPLIPNVEKEIEKVPKKGELVKSNFDLEDDSVKESEHYVEFEKTLDKNRVLRVSLMSLFLLIVATALEFVRLTFSFLPSFLDVDISIFPEFIGLVFFGPVIGITIVVFKNLLHMLIFFVIHGNISYVGELSNLITDTVFILIAFLVFRAITSGLPATDVRRSRRRLGVFVAGTVSSIATSIILLPVMNYVIYPMFEVYFHNRDHQDFNVLSYYTEKLASITSIWQGLIIYNLTWEFSKLMVVTIFATSMYIIVTENE